MAKADLGLLGKEVLAAAKKGLLDAAKVTEAKLKENVGWTDHTQIDLDELGNPYAVDHYNPQILGHEEEVVHRQSSTLYNSVKIRQESDQSYAIGADEDLRDPVTGVKYVIDVIEGNSKMVGRNYPMFTLGQLEQDKSLEKPMEDAIKKGLDSI